MASRPRILFRFGTVNSHLYDKLDFDCHASRQAANSDRGSRMTAVRSGFEHPRTATAPSVSAGAAGPKLSCARPKIPVRRFKRRDQVVDQIVRMLQSDG